MNSVTRKMSGPFGSDVTKMLQPYCQIQSRNVRHGSTPREALNASKYSQAKYSSGAVRAVDSIGLMAH